MIETRERIIAATNELFRQHGYNGTSLKQISLAADATIGSIYHFFPGGKEALAAAVIESTGAAYRDLFESIADAASDPGQAFADFFAGAAVVLEETDFIDPCPIGTVAREVASTNEPLRLAAAAAFDSWVDAASRRLVAAGLPDDRATALGQTFVATVEGLFVLCRAKRSTAPLSAASGALCQLVAAAIDEAERAATSTR